MVIKSNLGFTHRNSSNRNFRDHTWNSERRILVGYCPGHCSNSGADSTFLHGARDFERSL